MNHDALKLLCILYSRATRSEICTYLLPVYCIIRRINTIHPPAQFIQFATIFLIFIPLKYGNLFFLPWNHSYYL